MVILNGDIIDIWQFKKSYFPASHMKVLKRLLKWPPRSPSTTSPATTMRPCDATARPHLGKLRLVDQLDP